MSALYGKAAEWEVWTLSWGMTMRGTDQGTITERAQHKHSAVYWHMCSQANQQRVVSALIKRLKVGVGKADWIRIVSRSSGLDLDYIRLTGPSTDIIAAFISSV